MSAVSRRVATTLESAFTSADIRLRLTMSAVTELTALTVADNCLRFVRLAWTRLEAEIDDCARRARKTPR